MTRRHENTIKAKIQEAIDILEKTGWWHFLKRWALKTVIFSLRWALNEIELYLEDMKYDEKNET